MDAEEAVQWIDRSPTPALSAREGRSISVYGGLIVPRYNSDLALYVPGEIALFGEGGWDELIANLIATRGDRGRPS